MLYFISVLNGVESGYIAFRGKNKSIPYIELDESKANIFTFRKAHNFIKHNKFPNSKLQMKPVAFQSKALTSASVEVGLTSNKLKGIVFDICQLSRDLEETYELLMVKKKNNEFLTDTELELLSIIPKILLRQFRNVNLENIFQIKSKE